MTVAALSLIGASARGDYGGQSTLRTAGLLVGLAGLALATIALLGSLALAGAVAPPLVVAQDASTFALAIAALATLKLSIALILWGIVRRRA